MEPISTNHKVNMLIEEFDKIFIADRDETLKDGDKRGISFAMLPMHKKKNRRGRDKCLGIFCP